MIEEIKSIENYLNWVRNCSTLESAGLTWQQHHLYVRGQANCEWKLQPSVFVHKENEYELLQDAYRHAWKYLQDYPTDLEKMVVLQHYGLHTRLLDLTSNPLMALYFACSSYEGEDGKVFCYCASGDDGYRVASIIAKIVVHGVNKGLGLEQLLKNEYLNFYIRDKGEPIDKESFEQWKKRLYEPVFFHSPFNNNRITAQRGAFLMSPLDERDSATGSHFKENVFKNHGLWKEVLIDKDSKKVILEELTLLGIDESTVYPDLEHLLRFLNEKNSGSRKMI